MNAHTFSKYLAYARIGYIETRAEPGELYGRVVFVGVILGVFSTLWRAVAEAGMPLGDSPRTMVWYLAMTEWVLLSTPLIHFRIEEDIRRGDVAYQITRPASYLGAQLAEGIGALAARAPVLLVAACAAAFLFAGGPPERPSGLVWVVAFGAVASIVMTAFHLALGLLAFPLGEIAPVYWIWQKLMFVLGGLMLPLQIYPAWVVALALATPFPALLAGPASFMLASPVLDPVSLVLRLAVWFLAAWVVAHLVLRRATRALQLNGG
jgi:ABC-2 type transport system permease protein